MSLIQTEFQTQIRDLKHKSIAVYKNTTKTVKNYIPWNVTKIEPTTANMIRFTNSTKDEIEILKDGYYKIFYRFSSHLNNSSASSLGGGGLNLNGNWIGFTYNYSQRCNLINHHQIFRVFIVIHIQVFVRVHA